MADGRETIRKALLHRRAKLMTISERVDCGAQALDAFARGEVELSSVVLQALARELFHGSYDPVANAIFLTGGPPRPSAA